jgi:cytochrome c
MVRRFATRGVLLLATAFLYCAPVQAADVDVDAAKKLAAAGSNNCGKCHHATNKKDGATYKSIAEKYRNDAQAEAKLIKHLTTNPIVKYEDGTKEEHKVLTTNPPNDENQMKNLINWILSHK